jgi:hypothetical protein
MEKKMAKPSLRVALELLLAKQWHVSENFDAVPIY